MRRATNDEFRRWLVHNCGVWSRRGKDIEIPESTLAELVGFWLDHAPLCPQCVGEGQVVVSPNAAVRSCSKCWGLGRVNV